MLSKGREFKLSTDLVIQIGKKFNMPYSRVLGSYLYLVKKISRDSNNPVLNHGDVWAHNIMFHQDDPDKAILINFQSARYTDNSMDLVQLLYCCADVDSRAKLYLKILASYHGEFKKVLSENGFKIDSIDSRNILNNVSTNLFFGMMNALIYYPLILLKKPENATDEDYHLLFHKFATRKDNSCVFEHFRKNKEYFHQIMAVADEFLGFCDQFSSLPEDNETHFKIFSITE